MISGCTSTPAAAPESSSAVTSASISVATADPQAAARAAAARAAAAAQVRESQAQRVALEKTNKARAAARAAAQAKAVAAAKAHAKAVAHEKSVAHQKAVAREKAARAAKIRAAKAARARAAARDRIDPLTGGARSRQPVIAVKLDNTSKGRPQWGIDRADNVYVEQVEGGLTRIIAIFHTDLPAQVGPVRSVRTTDAQLLPAYGRPLLVFSGGAGGPLIRLAATRVQDASSLGGTSRTGERSAPYNLVANLAQIGQAWTAAYGRDFPIQTPGWHFQDNDPTIRSRAQVSRIGVQMGVGRTDFQWQDNAWRVMPAGTPGTAADGTPLRANNVLVMRVTDVPDGTIDSVGSPSLLSQTVGHGSVELFRNGRVIKGTWSRAEPNHSLVLRDENHQLITFSTGKTWVMLVPQEGSVSTG